MKIILTQDVPNLGKTGEVHDVAPGYARNYLIPQEMAIVATPGAIKQFKIEQKAHDRREMRLAARAAELVEQLNQVTLTFEAKAGPTGRLYGSVTTSDIAEALKEVTGETIDRRKIMSDPLRDIGQHTVGIEVTKDATAEIKVLVYREGEDPESVMVVEEPEPEPEPEPEHEEEEETEPTEAAESEA
jgi:large subunit ribosomal protein L9